MVTVGLGETGRGVTARNRTDPEGRLHNTPSRPPLSPRSQAPASRAPSSLLSKSGARTERLAKVHVATGPACGATGEQVRGQVQEGCGDQQPAPKEHHEAC